MTVTTYRNFETTTYRNATKLVRFDEWMDGHGCYRRGEKTEIYVPRELQEIVDRGGSAGDWYFALNDGHIDVGVFTSEDAALADAKKSIDHYHDVMCGATAEIIGKLMFPPTPLEM
jgi:hypothetical protein